MIISRKPIFVWLQTLEMNGVSKLVFVRSFPVLLLCFAADACRESSPWLIRMNFSFRVCSCFSAACSAFEPPSGYLASEYHCGEHHTQSKSCVVSTPEAVCSASFKTIKVKRLELHGLRTSDASSTIAAAHLHTCRPSRREVPSLLAFPSSPVSDYLWISRLLQSLSLSAMVYALQRGSLPRLTLLSVTLHLLLQMYPIVVELLISGLFIFFYITKPLVYKDTNRNEFSLFVVEVCVHIVRRSVLGEIRHLQDIPISAPVFAFLSVCFIRELHKCWSFWTLY